MRLLFILVCLVTVSLSVTACDDSNPQGSVSSRDHDEHESHDGHESHSDHEHGDHEAHGNDGHDEHDSHEGHDTHSDHEHGGHEGRSDDDHESHDDHDAHSEGEHSDHVALTPEAAREAGIVVSTAKTRLAGQSLVLPAELRFDADRVAVISPLISGLIQSLSAGEGDVVSRGDMLAVFASRELADLKAEYLSAATDETLARQVLAREETLFADRITSEADLETARAALASARVQRQGLENKLQAVGVSDAQLVELTEELDGSLATTELRAPIGGVIAQRTAMLGASVSADDPGAPALFTIVDDSVLWADITVYKQDIGRVRAGSPVVLRSETGARLADGEIAVMLPTIDEMSRTATARMIVDNSERQMRPGQFVTADITTGNGELALQVPSKAIVEVEGRTCIFVPTSGGFEPREIVSGSRLSGQAIVLSGLSEGEQYVSEGAFTLKAQLEKDAFGDDHNH